MARETGNFIKIRGARVHNLQNISLDIPKNKLVVITGLSGSGKSSLAFDTIYAEAERRFVESLSSYARQFLGVRDKPEVGSIDGLSPAISIDQRSISKNPRSTVGTITEIYDYIRILFARIGKPHCPGCQKPVTKQTVDHIISSILRLPKNNEILILAPLVQGKKGEHKSVLEEVKIAGFIRVRLNKEMILLDDALSRKLDRYKKHSIEVVVDRFALENDIDRSRVRDSVEMALKIGKGQVVVEKKEPTLNKKTKTPSAEEQLFSENFACIECEISLPVIEPRTFSFNSPYGACQACTGLGSTLEIDPEFVIPNKRLSIAEGAIRPWASASHRLGRQSWYWWILDDLSSRYKFSLNTPAHNLPPNIIDIILYGEGTTQSSNPKVQLTRLAKTQAGEASHKHEKGIFEGVIPNLKRRWKETDSDFTRAEIEKYMIVRVCQGCGGRRLRKEALAVRVGDENIASIVDRTVQDSHKFFKELLKKKFLSKNERIIASPIAKELIKRLEFLMDVGVEYLTLSRESISLSGGESQRIRLATQIGSRLTGIIYILDEPSIGLHQRDHARLIKTLKNLRDLGNTVIVIEHDAQTMHEADWIIDLGPGAGKYGGKIIFSGTPQTIMKSSTLTGEYLSGRKKIYIPHSQIRNPKISNYLIIEGAEEHNLKNIDVKIPLGEFVCISGVSGSGKSTLINDILARFLLAKFYGAHLIPGKYKSIKGVENLNKVVVVDQSPIGRTPRSNPVTYTATFGFIREVFARMPEARARGYNPGRFSFNVRGGRCEMCEGQGVKKIEMHFLPDVYVDCEECRGRRYNREALEVEYNGKNIAEVLDMSIEESMKFFESIPQIKSKLETMHRVGLDYMKVGQPAPTLSGGEAQRIKLAAELSRRDTGKTIYILDEPTTGLHFEDIRKLLEVFRELVFRGNTVLVIEHNLDVLKNADWIIDLGPEGGEKGGSIVFEGTPQEIKNNKKSYTGLWLANTPIP